MAGSGQQQRKSRGPQKRAAAVSGARLRPQAHLEPVRGGGFKRSSAAHIARCIHARCAGSHAAVHHHPTVPAGTMTLQLSSLLALPARLRHSHLVHEPHKEVLAVRRDLSKADQS